MKKTTLFLALAVIAIAMFSACKKDSTTSRSTLERLQAKWNFQKEYYHENYASTGDHRDTTNGPTTDYVDFRTDNKAYSHLFGTYDTASYALISSDSKIVLTYGVSPLVYKDTLDIQVLTDNALQVYNKVFDPAPDYYESTDFFTK